MKKLALIVAGVLILLIGGFLVVRSRMNKGGAEAVLKVTSTPTATVFLDDKKIGSTPLEEKVDAGEFKLKLISESSTENSVSWEETISLSANLLTYVNRELGASELESAGEVLTLEKISADGAQVAVLSTPDGATVSLDGQSKGTTPTIIEGIEVGSFDLKVETPGYKPRSVKIKTSKGYKLTAAFQLAASDMPANSPTPSSSPSPTSTSSVRPSPRATTPSATARTSPRPSPRTSPTASAVKSSPPPKPYVEILDTPVGFLRVRKEPSTSSDELARVNPGEFYSLLDEESGWYKIEYEDAKEGWVSSQYAEKSE